MLKKEIVANTAAIQSMLWLIAHWQTKQICKTIEFNAKRFFFHFDFILWWHTESMHNGAAVVFVYASYFPSAFYKLPISIRRKNILNEKPNHQIEKGKSKRKIQTITLHKSHQKYKKKKTKQNIDIVERNKKLHAK